TRVRAADCILNHRTKRLRLRISRGRVSELVRATEASKQAVRQSPRRDNAGENETFYPCPSVAKNQPSKADRTSKKTSDLATDGHGYTRMRSGRLPRARTGRRLEQNCMVMFWRNAILALPSQKGR